MQSMHADYESENEGTRRNLHLRSQLAIGATTNWCEHPEVVEWMNQGSFQDINLCGSRYWLYNRSGRCRWVQDKLWILQITIHNTKETTTTGMDLTIQRLGDVHRRNTKWHAYLQRIKIRSECSYKSGHAIRINSSVDPWSDPQRM